MKEVRSFAFEALHESHIGLKLLSTNLLSGLKSTDYRWKKWIVFTPSLLAVRNVFSKSGAAPKERRHLGGVFCR